MAMRLLNKREVDQAKAREKQTVIAEGMKLAKRVDNLREVSAAEEASLEKYRVETLAKIQDEINTKTHERNALTREVEDLEERRALALAPLESREKELNERHEIQEAREEMLNVLANNVNGQLGEVEKREKEVTKKEAKVALMHTQANDLLAEASTIVGNAEAKERLADGVLQKAQNEASAMTRYAEQREDAVTAREEAVAIREENNRVELIEIAKQWSLLKDREETFNRNKKRK